LCLNPARYWSGRQAYWEGKSCKLTVITFYASQALQDITE
jgi:hypothetical protein